MQLRYLEYFSALARERHFGRAAQACHVAQPTLSAGIVALEETLGQQLVLRDRRFLDLTPEGYAVLPFAQQMIADYSAMRTAIDSETGPLRGTVRLGVIPAAIPCVGDLVASLSALHPNLKVAVQSMTSREIERALIAHDLDAGITYLSSEPLAQVRSLPLYQERFVFATRRSGPFAGRATVTVTEAAAQPLCLLHQGMQNRRILDAVLAERQLQAEPMATADSYVALFAMVAYGGLDAIVTDSHRAIVEGHPEIVLIPFSDSPPPNQIGLVVPSRDPISPLSRVMERVAQRFMIDNVDRKSANPI